MLADPGEGTLDDPAARQHLDGVRLAPADKGDAQVQGGLGPDGELAVTSTVSISPPVPTAMWRLRPFTFLALFQPRLALGTVPAAAGTTSVAGPAIWLEPVTGEDYQAANKHWEQSQPEPWSPSEEIGC